MASTLSSSSHFVTTTTTSTGSSTIYTDDEQEEEDFKDSKTCKLQSMVSIPLQANRVLVRSSVYMGASFEKRAKPWVATINPDDVHSVCLQDEDGKLWVGESGHENEKGEEAWQNRINGCRKPTTAAMATHKQVRDGKLKLMCVTSTTPGVITKEPTRLQSFRVLNLWLYIKLGLSQRTPRCVNSEDSSLSWQSIMCNKVT
ncbi:hypothetical protein FRX31_033140 [Thalictrum thalictroides]|uniref:Uncharacterized protein n=1 Tax=Thalictrum thalictroides TaxID=46969 RepID=A0A7J6UYK5_THATH|nr:hypothetical protein FRX31_033140 [Thalictrum thalictroides]